MSRLVANEAAPLRVLHCPNNIAGNPSSLARAEREIGLRSVCVAFGPSAFGYTADEMLWDDDAVPSRTKAQLRGRLLARALREFDVVHFNFGQTIAPPPRLDLLGSTRLRDRARSAVNEHLWLSDLPILRAAGKVVAVTFQGDDARQGDYAADHFRVNASEHVDADYYTPFTDALKRRAIQRFDRHADLIYAVNPDLLHVLPERARFIPYASVDPRQWTPQPPRRKVRPVVLHAPTHRGVKGTHLVLRAVNELKAAGEDFDFVLVEGLSHEQARALYADADILVDQLLLGWYGALAVELMALGKPVICYVRSEDLGFLPPGMREDMPLLSAEPATITEVLQQLLRMSAQQRAELGMRGRDYVTRWHDPVRIASGLAGDYARVRASRRGARDLHSDVTSNRE